jgi:hypothetical protein
MFPCLDESKVGKIAAKEVDDSSLILWLLAPEKRSVNDLFRRGAYDSSERLDKPADHITELWTGLA